MSKILRLEGFNAELKTKDILKCFAEWEEQGGLVIRWIDDVTCLLIFGDVDVG